MGLLNFLVRQFQKLGIRGDPHDEIIPSTITDEPITQHGLPNIEAKVEGLCIEFEDLTIEEDSLEKDTEQDTNESVLVKRALSWASEQVVREAKRLWEHVPMIWLSSMEYLFGVNWEVNQTQARDKMDTSEDYPEFGEKPTFNSLCNSKYLPPDPNAPDELKGTLTCIRIGRSQDHVKR
jgi:hypothetical protein